MDEYLAKREPEILEPESEFGKLGVVRTYGPGAELLQQGEPADDVYLIHEGVVKLVWADVKGRQTIVGLRFSGSFLGTSAVITTDVCPTGAITVARSVIERVSADRFLDGLREDPELAWRVHQIHSRELYEQLNWLGEPACCPARSRVANLLMRLAASGEPNGSNNARVHLPLKRKEIAELIAITPEHLSRLLHEFSKEGYIAFRDGWIVVADPQALATI
jgi:CRP-like cAMP-binding protein